MGSHRRFQRFASCFAIVSLAVAARFADAAELPSEQTKSFFADKVFPLLESKCFGCHGEAKDREAEFDMRTREGLLKGGESGEPALVPQDPDKSRLFQAVLRHGKLKMPPKDRNKLGPDEIEILRQWISAGAIWPQPAQQATKPNWEYKPEDIWAFQPLNKVQVPEPQAKDNTNVIDRFVVGKLREHGLTLATPADRRTLIRRATFDLTGLPPTPDEMDAFVKDKSAKAFERVIDRLLASPRYGEQWGRHWLDVVRYADTDGFSNDYERPNAWRYRDYVIRSFNADKPYDQFLQEQVAGDELDPADPEKVIATGMLRMGPWEQTAMSVAAVTRQLFLDDVTHNVSATFLGLTVGCARCHDHKFDPIPTRDYYRLQSIYAPVQFELRKAPFLSSENTGDFSNEVSRAQVPLAKLKERLREITGKHDRAVKEFIKQKGYAVLRDVPLSERPSKELGLTPTESSTEKVLRKRIEYLERELQRYQPQALSVSSSSGKEPAPRLHVLVGGSLETPGEAVNAGVLIAVNNRGRPDRADEDQTIPAADGSRRLALAQWMTRPEHPLTARVMVNRVWQWHFGAGIVGTANNFGKMGKKPTHPELLDLLAQYFIDQKWSVKQLHRLIMTSAVYQQSATPRDPEAARRLDPEEKLLSHFRPRRLTAEELRDSMLWVAGELSTNAGGPPVFPEINQEAALQPRHIMGGIAPPYQPSPKREQRNRRTIYTVQIRTLANPLLEVFNQPNTDNSCERRDSTTVTPQVFALFNSQAAHDVALAMAQRLQNSSRSNRARIEQLFRLAYGRLPTDAERNLCSKHLESSTEHHWKTKPVKFQFPKRVVQSIVEELTGDPFEFEEQWDMSGYEYNLQPTEVTAETRALADLCLVVLNSNEFVYVY